MVDGKQLDHDSDLTVCSACNQITIFKISETNAKLPKLVVLINSFIHMSTSSHCLKNFKMSGQFWSVFSNFSMLGDVARHYLLQT